MARVTMDKLVATDRFGIVTPNQIQEPLRRLEEVGSGHPTFVTGIQGPADFDIITLDEKGILRPDGRRARTGIVGERR